MNRLLIGILCGIVFGIADALMVVFGKQPDKTTSVILQAFFSRFAIERRHGSASAHEQRKSGRLLSPLAPALPPSGPCLGSPYSIRFASQLRKGDALSYDLANG